MMTDIDAPQEKRRNPWVGPRALRAGELLPARERETNDLTDLLIAERVILLHAPSGAGKTSLIQAGVVPRLKEEWLPQGKSFRPTILLRVKTPAPTDRVVHNRYVHSIALDLLPDHNPRDLGSLTLLEVVGKAFNSSTGQLPVLIFDQFEDVLTLDPADRPKQEEFFAELGEVLAQGRVWALLAIREEYMGGLDRFLHFFPNYLQATYRLDFLDLDGARLAIHDPPHQVGVTVHPDAIDELINRLRTIKVQSPNGEVAEAQAPYVQPFQLQVVCRNLWKALSKRGGDIFTAIEFVDVEQRVDVGAALRGYYRDAVAEVATSTGADERIIRDWFDNDLITPDWRRSQTQRGPVSGCVDPKKLADMLQDAYLVRSDTRAGTTWYELAHDQLTMPILEDNRRWRSDRLEPWQLAAHHWHAKHGQEFLLSGDALRSAQSRAAEVGATESEEEFLQESARVDNERGMANWTLQALGWVGLLASAEAVAVVVLIIFLLRRRLIQFFRKSRRRPTQILDCI